MGSKTVLFPASKITVDKTEHTLKEQYGGERIVTVTFGYVKDEDYPHSLPLSEYMRESVADRLKAGELEIRHDLTTREHVLYEKATGKEIPRLSASIY